MSQPQKAYLRSLLAWGLGSLGMVVCSLACLVALLLNVPADDVHSYTRVWGRFVLWLSGVRVEVQGLENIDHRRAQLIVANHQGSFDIWALMGWLPIPFRWVMKKELFRIPLMGQAMKRGGYVGIDRHHPHKALQDMKKVLALLRDGKSIIIFPEGTRSRNGKVGRFKRGGFMLAYRSGVPIIPISINGSFDIMRRGSWLISPHPIRMVIHKPIEVTGLDREARQQLPEQVRQKIIDHL